MEELGEGETSRAAQGLAVRMGAPHLLLRVLMAGPHIMLCVAMSNAP